MKGDKYFPAVIKCWQKCVCVVCIMLLWWCCTCL